jgi:hypothetical protein
VSFLRAEGHAQASRYPLWMLWGEVEVAQQRNNQLLASEAILTQAAVSALLSKEGAKVFQKAIKRLTDDD